MKKLSILICLVALIAMAACSPRKPKVTMKTDIDSISFNLGYTSTDGIVPYLKAQYDIDSTELNEFVRGVQDGIKIHKDKKNKAYYTGIEIAARALLIKERMEGELFTEDTTLTLNENNYIAGFMAGVANRDPEKDPKKLQNTVDMQRDAIRKRIVLEKYADQKRINEEFLQENAKKEGVVVLESGLQYKILTEGAGDIPTEKAKVKVNYTGTTIDGVVFDSNANRTNSDGEVEPTKFAIRQLVKGWQEALKMMPCGSKWELYIPADLAYGNRSQGSVIKPFSTLIFEVELVEVEEPAEKK